MENNIDIQYLFPGIKVYEYNSDEKIMVIEIFSFEKNNFVENKEL